MTSTYYNWFRRLLILGAVVATGAFASTAGAMPQDAGTTNTATADVVRPPDVQDSATALYTTAAGLKADGLRWQGIAKRYEALGQSYSYPTALGLKAEGMRLQGTAQVYQNVQAGPDAFERYAAAHPFGQELSATSDLGVSRPPDVSDVAARASASTADVFERYAAAHPYGQGLSGTTDTGITRPPDVQDVASSVGSSSSSETIISRPPDVQDAALVAQYSSTTSQSDSFSWNDWGVGIGTGMGIVLLLGIGLVMSRQHRHGVQTA
jgi:hypothetical protein